MARRQLHDKYFRQAKEEGYVARSAYKLADIDRKWRLLRRGDRVLDLGCSPGSWLQVASQRVGPDGLVVGIDLKAISPEVRAANVRAKQGDAFETDPASLVQEAGGVFDVVLSDMAPNTSGAGDDSASVWLCRRVLEVARGALREQGALVMKVLEGGEYPDLLRETAGLFAQAKGYKPPASRAVSREMFIVATGFKAEAPQRDASAARTGGPPAPSPGWSSGGSVS